MKQNIKTQSGNRIVAVFDGKQIGLAKSISISESYGLEPVTGIGDMRAVENVPTVARYSVSVSKLLLKKDLMVSSGLIPENSDAVLQGLVFDLEIYDKDSAVLLKKVLGCSYDSGSVEFAANAIITRSAQFLALDIVGLESN